MNAKLSLFLRKILPFFLVRFFLRLCFRVRVEGLENYEAAGDRVLIIANHVSRIDAVLLSAFLPERILFATQASIAHRWWLKPYWHLGDAYSLDQANPMTAKMMVDAIKQGRKCMLFPEGRVTRTGALMKVYESPGMIADKAGAKILPIRIDGPQYSFFSGVVCKAGRRLFPKITLTILPPQSLDLPEEVKGHKRRLLAGTKLYDLMEHILVEGMPRSTLLRQLMATRSLRGGRNVVLEDVARVPLSHDAFVTKFFTLSRLIARVIGEQEKNIGVMMPNGIPNATILFAIQALDRVTAMINFTSGPLRVLQACQMAQIRTVITSRGFISALQLTPIVETLTREKIEVVYLEDLAAKAGWIDRLISFVRARLPLDMATAGLSKSQEKPALLLFTSGTEGKPKGVMLSHKNIIANCFQTGVRIGFTLQDSMFACLPMFHSFGLTLGFFAPLFYGTRTFLFPSPLRYHDIPELVYDTGATALLGTDTFLANYARNAAPHDFYFIRFAIGGAEKIKPETRRVWAEKFGVRLFEGYGTTEAAPVIGVNSPLHYKAGSIGRAVTGLDMRLDPVEGIKNGYELVVRGLNVMMGYIKAERPGFVEPVENGWYNTGDVVSVDEEGFITILGRTKRFAKIAGEMVSLGAIEAVICALWPEARHVAVSVPHDRKGEMIVLLSESQDVDLNLLPDHFRMHGLTELSLPRKLIRVAQVPLLGSGKTDYVRARELAIEETGSAV